MARQTLKHIKRIGKRRTAATVVLRSQFSFSLERLLSSVTASSIERYKDGKIALFMCHVAASCPSDEIKLHKAPTRMDFDPAKGTIRVWLLEYNARKPDVVIENVVAPANP